MRTAQLAPITVVMHRADVKRLLERLLAVPPSTRSFLVTQTHIDGSTDDSTPLSKSSHVPQPDTLSPLDAHPNPASLLSCSISPMDPISYGVDVDIHFILLVTVAIQ